MEVDYQMFGQPLSARLSDNNIKFAKALEADFASPTNPVILLGNSKPHASSCSATVTCHLQRLLMHPLSVQPGEQDIIELFGLLELRRVTTALKQSEGDIVEMGQNPAPQSTRNCEVIYAHDN